MHKTTKLLKAELAKTYWQTCTLVTESGSVHASPVVNAADPYGPPDASDPYGPTTSTTLANVPCRYVPGDTIIYKPDGTQIVSAARLFCPLTVPGTDSHGAPIDVPVAIVTDKTTVTLEGQTHRVRDWNYVRDHLGEVIEQKLDLGGQRA